MLKIAETVQSKVVERPREPANRDYREGVGYNRPTKRPSAFCRALCRVLSSANS